jgi:hypothetical protein
MAHGWESFLFGEDYIFAGFMDYFKMIHKKVEKSIKGN